MPETPTKKNGSEAAGEPERDDSTWESDQRDREYYYDDSTGYEVYDPSGDDNEESEGEAGNQS